MDDFINKLQNDVNDLYKRLKRRRLSLLKLKTVRMLKIVNKSIPFILAGYISYNSMGFILTKILSYNPDSYKKVKYIQEYSNGKVVNTVLRKYDEGLYYVTKWIQNDECYERTIIHFNYSGSIDVKKIYKYSLEDLENNFEILECFTETRKQLFKNEILNNDDAIMTCSKEIYYDNSLTPDKTFIVLIYLLSIFHGGCYLTGLRKQYFKNKIENYLERMEGKLEIVEDDKYQFYKNILNQKRTNLNFLNSDESVDDINSKMLERKSKNGRYI